MKILLWFAWKFVPSWYQQQRVDMLRLYCYSCDLLENSYLCGISNNNNLYLLGEFIVVICLKIRTFVVSATTAYIVQENGVSCDLLENSYLCGISNNNNLYLLGEFIVVICLKIRTFVVSATTAYIVQENGVSCDLLENSYLCGISNNLECFDTLVKWLWFAWKFVPLWYQQQQHH